MDQIMTDMALDQARLDVRDLLLAEWRDTTRAAKAPQSSEYSRVCSTERLRLVTLALDAVRNDLAATHAATSTD